MELSAADVQTVHSSGRSNRRTLSECFGTIYQEGTLTDVKFLVGEDRVEISAHKLILSARSTVFMAMFNGVFESKDEIYIDDSNADNFKLFLGFLYTDEVECSPENVMGLLHLASKYDIPLLFDKAVATLIEKISTENACAMLTTAKKYASDELKGAVLDYICINAKNCLKSESFLQLDCSEVEDIASSENLSCSEEDLFECLITWAERRCKNNKLDITGENMRNALGKLLYVVRFPLMDYDYIKGKISKQSILTDSELVAILQMHGEEEEEQVSVVSCTTIFNSRARKGLRYDTVILIRCGRYSLSSINPAGENMITVLFELSNDTWFHGLVIYGPCEKTRFCFEITVSCVKTSMVLASCSNVLTSDDTKHTCDILLDAPVYLGRAQKYRCSLKLFTTCPSQFYRIDKEFPVVEKFSHSQNVYSVTHGRSFIAERPVSEQNEQTLPELAFRHKTVTLHAKSKLVWVYFCFERTTVFTFRLYEMLRIWYPISCRTLHHNICYMKCKFLTEEVDILHHL